MTRQLAQEYPVQAVCETLGWTRSSYYYHPRMPDESALREALQLMAGEWPTYGYRRLTAQLQRQGWSVNSKRVRRLMRQLHLLKRKKGCRTTQSEHGLGRYPNLVCDQEVTQPDQVWVSDIHGPLGVNKSPAAIFMDKVRRYCQRHNLDIGIKFKPKKNKGANAP